MEIKKTDLEALAALARLEFCECEYERLGREIGEICESMSCLAPFADTVPDTEADGDDGTREDIHKPLPREYADGYICVPLTVEAES